MTRFFTWLRRSCRDFKLAWDVEHDPRGMTRYMRQLDWEAKAGSKSAAEDAAIIRQLLTLKHLDLEL